MENFNAKKIFLYLLTCSIGLSALMGIWAILSGEFGETQGKVLFTTLTVVGTSILGLACGAFLESPRSAKMKPVPLVGILLAVLSGLACFLMIWRDDFDKTLSKFALITFICAFSLAQLSLLSMARLAKQFRWSLVAVYVAVFVLDAIICPIIIFELSGDDGLVLRLIGTLSVIAASLTVMIPIFHWLSRSEFAGENTISTAEIDTQIDKLKAEIAELERRRNEINNANDFN